jgi:hypothetical protein
MDWKKGCDGCHKFIQIPEAGLSKLLNSFEGARLQPCHNPSSALTARLKPRPSEQPDAGQQCRTKGGSLEGEFGKLTKSDRTVELAIHDLPSDED